MKGELLQPGQATVLVVAVITTLAIPAGAVAGGMVGPGTADDSEATPTADGPTDGNAAADSSGTIETGEVDRALASELLAKMDDESRSQREVALDAADTVLESRQQQATGGWSQLERRQIATQRTNLRGARALLEINDDTGRDAQDRGVWLTEAGMKLQFAQQSRSDQPVDPTSVELPSVRSPSHNSPSAAAFGLLERENVTPTATESDEIRSLDDLPEPIRTELTDVLDAYIAYHDATQAAAGEMNLSRLRVLADNWTRLQAADVDMRNQVARVRAAQLQLLEESVDLETSLTDSGSFTYSGSRVMVAQTLCLGTGADETYTTDCGILIDPGGDDEYNNNAGGAQGFGDVAALIDLDGSDRYHGRNGGASGFGAAGFLLDTTTSTSSSADDTYDATQNSQPGNGTNGGANSFGSAGFLLDSTGSDKYFAGNNATNGGARLVGQGFLLDVGSSATDYYSARKEGTNGGARLQGNGFLLDAGGGDVYNTSVNNINGVDVHTRSPSYDGGDLGTNGGGSNGGQGFLLDGGLGDDSYEAEGNGTNGGGRFFGVGFLLDLIGGNTYTANPSEQISYGTNGGGGTGGIGVLVDVFGSDTYTTTSPDEIFGANGGGAGSTIHSTGNPLGAPLDGNGVLPASGLLVDAGTTGDTYRATDSGGNSGVNGGAYFNASGTLVDGVSSGDRYVQNNCDRNDDTWIPKGIAGAQIDLGLNVDTNPTGCG